MPQRQGHEACFSLFVGDRTGRMSPQFVPVIRDENLPKVGEILLDED